MPNKKFKGTFTILSHGMVHFADANLWLFVSCPTYSCSAHCTSVCKISYVLINLSCPKINWFHIPLQWHFEDWQHFEGKMVPNTKFTAQKQNYFYPNKEMMTAKLYNSKMCSIQFTQKCVNEFYEMTHICMFILHTMEYEFVCTLISKTVHNARLHLPK